MSKITISLELAERISDLLDIYFRSVSDRLEARGRESVEEFTDRIKLAKLQSKYEED